MLTQSHVIFVFAFDIRLICSEYESKVYLHKILKFVYLHSTNSLSVKYMNSKHDARLVMKYVYRASTFISYISI